MDASAHPGMTAEFFETAVVRAINAELDLLPSPKRGNLVYVTSTKKPGVLYATTRTTCSCLGHQHSGRCLHRAFAIWANDELDSLRVRREAGRVAMI